MGAVECFLCSSCLPATWQQQLDHSHLGYQKNFWTSPWIRSHQFKAVQNDHWEHGKPSGDPDYKSSVRYLAAILHAAEQVQVQPAKTTERREGPGCRFNNLLCHFYQVKVQVRGHGRES